MTKNKSTVLSFLGIGLGGFLALAGSAAAAPNFPSMQIPIPCLAPAAALELVSIRVIQHHHCVHA